jgi:hypothetical protein
VTVFTYVFSLNAFYLWHLSAGSRSRTSFREHGAAQFTDPRGRFKAGLTRRLPPATITAKDGVLQFLAADRLGNFGCSSAHGLHSHRGHALALGILPGRHRPHIGSAVMSNQTDGKPAATGQAALQEDPHRYRIVPIGSGPTGWAIERDGRIWRTGPRIEVLGAWPDAHFAGASSYDADDIAKVIERRPRPSYEERLAVFNATGRPEPSRDPFPNRPAPPA